MIDISENFFAINNDVGVNSNSYELYSNNGYKKIITSFNLNSIQNLDLLLNLSVSFGFSLINQDDFNFEQKNTYHLRDVYDVRTNTLNIEVALENDSVSDLFAYVRIFDEEDPENIYDKSYKEQVIDKNTLIVSNFVDYSLKDNSSLISAFKSPFQLQEELFEKNYNENQNYSYTSNLFHFFRNGNQVNCFFGIDTVSYVKDNNPVRFLNNDNDFNNYIKSNNPVEDIEGYVYADKQHVFVTTTEVGVDLQDDLGRVYGFTFDLPKEFERSNLYGYEAQISFRDIVVQFLNNELLPNLRTENKFLRELEIEQQFTTINTAKLTKTLSTYAAYLTTVADNASQVMALFLTSPNLVLNDKLRNILLTINQTVSDVLLKALKAKNIPSTLATTMTKDFGSVIDPSRVDYGVEVLGTATIAGLIDSYSLGAIVERSQQELQKFFEGFSTNVDVSGEKINIASQSSTAFSSIGLFIDGKQELDNQKSPNDEFSYDESLNYLNTINKIVNKNIQKDPIIYPAKSIIALSDAEVATEDRTIQNNGTLNSLTVTQSENLRKERLTNNLLTIRDNIIKTFEVPSTLRTDLCAQEPTITQRSEGTTIRRNISSENFVGNSLISFGVLNKIKSLKENDFYEPYLKILRTTAEDIRSAPIQASYLFNYYSQNREEPSFLRTENLLGEITSFGVNYHNFKSLFSIKIYLSDEREFVSLDGSVLNSLSADRNYLCVIDHYRNINYGMETPELLKTSIYNKYFILTT
tara:strand:+ start:16668 stop:18923 length:2256 start_codon:yes stop_codon:yes gene_type:complete